MAKGFASKTPEERARLGSLGGRAAQAGDRPHRFTPETAKAAGRIPHERGTAHHWTSEEARVAGRKGGQARGRGVVTGQAGHMASDFDVEAAALGSVLEDEQ